MDEQRDSRARKTERSRRDEKKERDNMEHERRGRRRRIGEGIQNATVKASKERARDIFLLLDPPFIGVLTFRILPLGF